MIHITRAPRGASRFLFAASLFFFILSRVIARAAHSGAQAHPHAARGPGGQASPAQSRHSHPHRLPRCGRPLHRGRPARHAEGTRYSEPRRWPRHRAAPHQHAFRPRAARRPRTSPSIPRCTTRATSSCRAVAASRSSPTPAPASSMARRRSSNSLSATAKTPCSRPPPSTIKDWPALPHRGLDDDLSRGPVPTLEFQKRQVRTLAAYKLNIYSPYFEHTLQYCRIAARRAARRLDVPGRRR